MATGRLPQLPAGSGWHAKRARLITATLALMQAAAGRMEAAMKSGAPWTDRTALARGGLTATATVDGSKRTLGDALSKQGVWRISATLSHTQEYGKWLETVNGPAMGRRASMSADQLMDASNVGNYAIIHPTAARFGPGIVQQVKRLWGRP